MSVLRDMLTSARRVQSTLRSRLVGAPLPPRELQYLVSGNEELDGKDFLRIGQSCARSVRRRLERNDVDLDQFEAVLDFGCGCGRIVRHMTYFDNAKLYATDYDSRLIDWCKANLPFAEFGLNGLEPPLGYPDGRFDLVYAFSVFTHLTEELQISWVKELSRVLKPGGYLHVTLCGESYANQYLRPQDREKFRAGHLVVIDGDVAGTGQCMAYNPERNVRERLASEFDIVEFEPGRVIDASRLLIAQDTYLLRKAV